jgi:hypothetical protein
LTADEIDLIIKVIYILKVIVLTNIEKYFEKGTEVIRKHEVVP